eukprot:1341699-Pleurochrysis_carterae.AAC.1
MNKARVAWGMGAHIIGCGESTYLCLSCGRFVGCRTGQANGNAGNELRMHLCGTGHPGLQFWAKGRAALLRKPYCLNNGVGGMESTRA